MYILKIVVDNYNGLNTLTELRLQIVILLFLIPQANPVKSSTLNSYSSCVHLAVSVGSFFFFFFPSSLFLFLKCSAMHRKKVDLLVTGLFFPTNSTSKFWLEKH